MLPELAKGFSLNDTLSLVTSVSVHPLNVISVDTKNNLLVVNGSLTSSSKNTNKNNGDNNN